MVEALLDDGQWEANIEKHSCWVPSCYIYAMGSGSLTGVGAVLVLHRVLESEFGLKSK